jgi:glycogen synthase
MKNILMPDVMKVEHNVRVLQEAQSLQRAGYKVNIVGFSNKTKKRKLMISGINVISFYLHDSRTGAGKLYRYWSGLMMILGINLYVLTHKANIYHAHNFHVLPACWLASKLYGGKLIYDTHETWTIHRNKKYHLEHIFAYIIEKVFIHGIDAFITVNEMIVDYFKSFYKLNKPFITIYNTRDIVPINSKNLIRSILPIKDDEKIVFFVGGFWPNGRGIFELIDASKYLHHTCKIVLMGYGSSDMLRKMKQRIEENDASEKVFILPPQPPEKVMDFVMSADIGVNLIKRESKAQDFQSPWKLFEYCMGGLAVVSTDLPFHREVYTRYDIGAICATDNNPEDIADKVNKLVVSPNYSAYKKAARTAAEEEYNWSNQEKKLLGLYQTFNNTVHS